MESLLFSIIVSAMNQTPTLTLAKIEHRDTWLGRLIAHCLAYPGISDPGMIAHFDREDPASLPKIVEQLSKGISGQARSLMIHVEGTRAKSCDQPVTKMSGVFIDMALEQGAPIVPVPSQHSISRSGFRPQKCPLPPATWTKVALTGGV